METYDVYRTAITWIFGSLIFVIPRPLVSAAETHIFQVKLNGEKLEYRVSIRKKAALLTESIPADVWVKNASPKTVKISLSDFGKWIIKDTEGKIYPSNISIEMSVDVKSGDSIPVNTDFMRDYGLSSGKYWAFHYPEMDSFIFYVVEPVPIKNNDPIATTYSFLNQNKDIYGFDPPDSVLKPTPPRKTGGEIEVFFQQLYKGLNVWNSGLVAVYSATGEMKNIYLPFRFEINIPTSPQIGEKSAIQLIKRDLKLQNEDIDSNEINLIIYPFTQKYYLAWHMFKFQWHYFIDAKTGEILHKEWIHPPCVVE